MYPPDLTPYLRPMVWGGRRLQEALGKALPPGGNWGESWEISVHPTHVSQVASGPFAGRKLTDLCRDHRDELFGPSNTTRSTFPLLLKYLDARDWLSVQVHPDDESAPRLAGEPLGKTEAWVVLDVAPEGRIFAGLRAGVGRAELQEAIQAGSVADCLHSFVPRPGDCLFLRAGTVHAVGGGVLLAEVQQSSDATLRLFDWDRLGTDGKPRALHVPQALDAIDWRAGPVAPVRGVPLIGIGGGVEGEQLVRCEYFRLDRFRATSMFSSPYPNELSAWMVLDGQAELVAGEAYRRECRRGDTILIPASASDVRWLPSGPATFLGVTLGN